MCDQRGLSVSLHCPHGCSPGLNSTAWITAENHGIIWIGKNLQDHGDQGDDTGKVCMKVDPQLWGGKTNLSSQKGSVKHVGLGGFR